MKAGIDALQMQMVPALRSLQLGNLACQRAAGDDKNRPTHKRPYIWHIINSHLVISVRKVGFATIHEIQKGLVDRGIELRWFVLLEH